MVSLRYKGKINIIEYLFETKETVDKLTIGNESRLITQFNCTVYTTIQGKCIKSYDVLHICYVHCTSDCPLIFLVSVESFFRFESIYSTEYMNQIFWTNSGYIEIAQVNLKSFMRINDQTRKSTWIAIIPIFFLKPQREKEK